MFVTHPNNRQTIESRFFPAESADPLLSPFCRPTGIEIRYDELVPERKIETRWQPPSGDRFVEYEESDHAWLARLGAGHNECVDLGPLILEIRTPAMFVAWSGA